MRLTLPWPPSVNTYWRSTCWAGVPRVLLSAKGRQYKARVKNIVLAARATNFAGDFDRLAVTLDLYPENRRSFDVDNRAKAVLDALEAAGVYPDDDQIDRLTIVRHKAGKPARAEVTLELLP